MPADFFATLKHRLAGDRDRPDDRPAALAGVDHYTAAKGKFGGGPARKRIAAKSSRSPSIEDLIEAKKLADRLGGVDKARAAIAVLAKLL